MYRNRYSGGALWVVALLVLGVIGVVAGVSSNATKTKSVTETERIPYNTTYVDDETLAQGKSVTRTAGVYGTRTNTYKVTTKGGKETSRELVESSVIQEPRDAVVARGTKPAWHCYDTTSYDRNPYNDNYCEYSDGSGKYVPDSEARTLDPDYTPGKAGAAYYNNF